MDISTVASIFICTLIFASILIALICVLIIRLVELLKKRVESLQLKSIVKAESEGDAQGLIRAMRSRTSATVRQSATEALGRLVSRQNSGSLIIPTKTSREQIAKALINSLKDEDPSVQQSAVRALGVIKEDGATDQLITIFHNTASLRMQLTCYSALQEILGKYEIDIDRFATSIAVELRHLYSRTRTIVENEDYGVLDYTRAPRREYEESDPDINSIRTLIQLIPEGELRDKVHALSGQVRNLF